MNKTLLTSLGVILSVTLTGLVQAEPLVPPLTVKWSQLPDMQQGTDYLSMYRPNNPSDGPVVADDFRSNGQHIVGFHWWGSYFDPCDPGLPPPPDRTVQFKISFHPNCPAGKDCPQYTHTPHQANLISSRSSMPKSPSMEPLPEGKGSTNTGRC